MHVAIMAGTRPEVIKMAPVIRSLKQRDKMRVTVCATGQHREMLHQAFADFAIVPDENLDVMTAAQSLGSLSSALFERFDGFLTQCKPDWLLVQGDTTSVMVAALCAFYRNIHVGHVEAGLRSHNMRAPFPEELNRRVTALVADIHFAPTENARQNLLAEKIPAKNIAVTGNTVADALLQMLESLRGQPPKMPAALVHALASDKRIVLFTAHRRENHGAPLRRIFGAIKLAALSRDDALFVYPVHPNPAVSTVAKEMLGGCPNILLLDPFTYPVLLSVMERSEFIVTDSGGIQEEGCILRKPVLVLRETTERSEGVDAGAAKLLGSDTKLIGEWLGKLFDDAGLRTSMISAAGALYGDGKAAERIADCLMAYSESRMPKLPGKSFDRIKNG